MLTEHLRQETRQHHTSLEEVVGFATSLEHHRALLRGFFGFLAPWETALAASPHASLLHGREKTPLLLKDLRQSGMSQAEIDSLPLCRDLPSVTTRPSVLGALYVIEGSTLGGQMISRHLETTLGLRNGAGYGYFRSYGPDTPEKWREFRGILLAHSGPGVDDLIVSSAQNTFACLHRWFEAVLACAR